MFYNPFFWCFLVLFGFGLVSFVLFDVDFDFVASSLSFPSLTFFLGDFLISSFKSSVDPEEEKVGVPRKEGGIAREGEGEEEEGEEGEGREGG